MDAKARKTTLFTRLKDVKINTDAVMVKQSYSMEYLKKVTKALFTITEQLAEKEIEIDPKEFVHRETITRVQRQ